ncbi:hypothetical protein M8C21_015083 [Ambrosia artemisiifolia]|uniref:Uncharacterized protein n=1 Tax=Ambrosia artemisiifolia TaxID=4212 RepID=A0AAD5GVE4_AMBAR|nr:hypothetical protein M8C21_015083 [Ambrosia artemisiifolia]
MHISFSPRCPRLVFLFLRL